MARQSQPDPAALANWAADQALRRMRFEQDIITIGQEFPEVFSDETLTQVAALKVGALRQQAAMLRVQTPDLALYRDACGAVMDALKGPNWRQPATERGSEAPPATQAASTVAVVSPAKLERKRAAPQQPTAVSRVASDDATKPWEGRRSDIVEQMRRTRGQSSMR
jgi:hypothetical protein